MKEMRQGAARVVTLARREGWKCVAMICDMMMRRERLFVNWM